MSASILIYLIVGMIWVKLEHDTFDFDFGDLSGRETAITVAQQANHYLRVLVCWPLYVIEDFLLWLDNG